MKAVWYVQDYDSMQIDEVFTTKKAAFEKAKETYGAGKFKPVTKGQIYWYFAPADWNEPACCLTKIPVRKAKRK